MFQRGKCCSVGARIIRIGFPLKGSLKGLIVEYYNVGALIIRIGFWGPLYYNYDKEPQNSIGNYLGPYIKYGSPRAFHSLRCGTGLCS